MTIELKPYTMKDLLIAVDNYKHALGEVEAAEMELRVEENKIQASRNKAKIATERMAKYEHEIIKIAKDVTR